MSRSISSYDRKVSFKDHLKRINDEKSSMYQVAQPYYFKIKPWVTNTDGIRQEITPEIAQNLYDNIDPAKDFYLSSNEIIGSEFDGKEYTVYMDKELTPADKKGIEQDIEAGKFMGGERGVWDVPEPDGMTDESFAADWQAEDITWPPGIDDPVDEGYPDHDDYGDDN